MNIKEIARLSGVSSATVSRIINNVGYVKAETRERVLKTMRSVGYAPSNIARSLSKRETPFIGVIVPDITNPFFSELVKSIEKVADRNGFSILFFDTDENAEKEHAVLRTIKEHWIRGLLMTPISWEDEVTERELLSLEDSGIPVVLMDRNLHRNNFSVMMVNNFQGGYNATKALLDLGHRKIAIVVGPWQDGPGDGRIKGYLQALRDYGIEPRPEYQVGSDFQVEGSYAACQLLMEQSDPPTAILSCGNTMTFGCLQYFREHALRIGEDIGLIGFDDVSVNRLLEGALSTVGCSLEKLGEEAFRLMAQRFREEQGHGLPPEMRILPAEVKLRGSERQKSIQSGCVKGGE